MSQKRVFTAQELSRARQMRANMVPWKKIGARLGCAGVIIQCELEPTHKEKVKIWNKNSVLAKRRVWKAGELVRDETPGEFMQKPLEFQPVPTTLDQIYFGDPLPGRSALDQMILS